jgi:hypothetical protein
MESDQSTICTRPRWPFSCYVTLPDDISTADTVLSCRPASRKQIKALEGKISRLEKFIGEVAAADERTRVSLLDSWPASEQPSESHTTSQERVIEDRDVVVPSISSPGLDGVTFTEARQGRMCKRTTRSCTQFYGGTSLFQMNLAGTAALPVGPLDDQARREHSIAEPKPIDLGSLQFSLGPKDQTCRQLMAIFFTHCYPFHMYVYREWFLRDYDIGGGPYYSDALMFVICAMGALVSPDRSQRHLYESLSRQAEAIILQSLNLPNITILQALIMLGYLEIGHGRSSKGWLYCGMAFRLTHEMGLHLDPSNWTRSGSESSTDREILRRVYWAAFIADKQLSVYFGRPPALHPHEADVRNTIRIPYPAEFERLLDMYICKGSSPTAFEDGVPLVACFVHQAELAKILHKMIVEVFENRRQQPSNAAEPAQQVHRDLVHWLSSLPHQLQWNQWTVDASPPYVLHLHMLFHTAMIILHRSPRQALADETVINEEDVELCYQSLSAILKLLKTYGKHYRFNVLPLDTVQTLASAAEIVMMRRYMDKLSWDNKAISQPMTQILEALEAMREVFPCVTEFRDSIVHSMQMCSTEEEQHVEWETDLMGLLQPGMGPFSECTWGVVDEPGSDHDGDLGFLVTDDFLNRQWL